MDQDFAVWRLVDARSKGLPGRLDSAVIEEPDQHERGVLGDVEGIVDFLARDTAFELGEGFGVNVVERCDDLMLELEKVSLLLRALATFGEADKDGVVGPNWEDRRRFDIIGRAVEDVFKGTHLVMLS